MCEKSAVLYPRKEIAEQIIGYQRAMRVELELRGTAEFKRFVHRLFSVGVPCFSVAAKWSHGKTRKVH
jgi:hypothetical protein